MWPFDGLNKIRLLVLLGLILQVSLNFLQSFQYGCTELLRERSLLQSLAMEDWQPEDRDSVVAHPQRLPKEQAQRKATKVVLFSVVKNEVRILPRLLESVQFALDGFVFCDTGSTDGTVEYLKNWFEESGVEGQLFQHKWSDFATNFNLCLESVRKAIPDATFLLRVDADFVLNVKSASWKEEIPADMNSINFDEGRGAQVYIPLLFSTKNDCYYTGVTHEYLSCEPYAPSNVPVSHSKFESISFTHLEDGSNRGTKYERDENMLKDQLQATPEDPRTTFYLARTLEESGKYTEAIQYYAARVELGGRFEEVWYSLSRIAVCKLQRGDNTTLVIEDVMRAVRCLPARGTEPLFYLTRALRLDENYDLCVQYGSKAVDITAPVYLNFFMDRSIYEWRLYDELSICLYWTGDYEKSITMAKAALAESVQISDVDIARIMSNMQWAKNKIEMIDRARNSFDVAKGIGSMGQMP